MIRAILIIILSSVYISLFAQECSCLCCDCAPSAQINASCELVYSSTGGECNTHLWVIREDGVAVLNGAGAASGSLPINLNAAQYTFEVYDNGDCSRTVTIDIPPAPNTQPTYQACNFTANADPTCPVVSTFCEVNLSDLFNIITTQFNNWSWSTDPGNPSIVTLGGVGLQLATFQKGNLSGLYTFNFDITFGNGCVKSTPFQIELLPNDDNQYLDVCQGDGIVDLFALTGLNSANYTVVQDLACSESNADFTMFNADNLATGTYLFALTNNTANTFPSCSNCQIYVEVNLLQELSAGTPGGIFLYCDTDPNVSNFDLFFLLNTNSADLGGTWSNGTYDAACNLIPTTGATATINNNAVDLTMNGCAKYEFGYLHENIGCDQSCVSNTLYFAETPTNLSFTAPPMQICEGDPQFTIDLNYTDNCSLPIGQANQNADGFYVEIFWNNLPPGATANGSQLTIDPNTQGIYTVSATIEVRNDFISFPVSNVCASAQADFTYEVEFCCPPISNANPFPPLVATYSANQLNGRFTFDGNAITGSFAPLVENCCNGCTGITFSGERRWIDNDTGLSIITSSLSGTCTCSNCPTPGQNNTGICLFFNVNGCNDVDLYYEVEIFSVSTVGSCVDNTSLVGIYQSNVVTIPASEFSNFCPACP